MKSFVLFIIVFVFYISSPAQKVSGTDTQEDWKLLFNGENLEGWDTFLGSPNNKPNQEKLGLNNDPQHVFSIVMADGQPALRISGAVFGGISTVEEYENYHLQLQFKWGKIKHKPRLNAPRDSGVLYHGVGNHGDGDGVWLRSQEFQVQEGDCGDYWGVAGAQMKINTKKVNDTLYQYDANGTARIFGQNEPRGRHVEKYPDAEKPSGAWNTLDLFCYQDKSAHLVNGVVTMILTDSAIVIDGETRPLQKGKIQLQSEGAEIFYRNIKIQPIYEFPKDF